MTRWLVLLLCCTSAQADSWSVGAALGTSRLDSRHHDDAEVVSEPMVALHASWWFHRGLALEFGWMHAATGYRTAGERVERDLDVALIGVRWTIPLGDRVFVHARAGYAKLHIDTQEAEVADGARLRDGADRSHILGAGLGWRWNTRWQSTLELTRVYGDVAYGCEFGACATTHSSYFDSLTLGFEYHFD